MRLSSSFVAPSAVALLSTVLMYGPAASQTNPSGPLPDITIEAPKHAARPHTSPAVAHSTVSHRGSRIARGPSTSGEASPGRGTPRGPVMARIASLEARASSCNGGCETSFKTGKEPWIGCSESTGGYLTAMFSTTCRDTLNYKNYADCLETKQFLGWDVRRARWRCSGLDSGNRFVVAEISKPKRHARRSRL
jgi:hypothetical protein